MERKTGVKSPTKKGFCPISNTVDGVKLDSFYGPDSSARGCKKCLHCKEGNCTSEKAMKSFGYKPGEEMKLDLPPRHRAAHCKNYEIY